MDFSWSEYKKFLEGEINFSELSLLLNTTIGKLKYYISKNKIITRFEYLQETTNHTFFDVIDNELKAYLLGFFYADGNIRNDNYISLSISEKDKEIIDLFHETLCPRYKVTKIAERKNKKTGFISKPMFSISFLSAHMRETLENYGITPSKTKNELKDLSFIPQHLMKHFIRGYWDGDGCSCVSKVKRKYILKTGEEKVYYYYNYNWNIISYTQTHLLILQQFLKEVYGIHANIILTKKKYFLLEVNRKKDFILLKDILYADAKYFLNRKRNKYMAIPC